MYSHAQESVKSFIFSPKIKWIVIVGVLLFLLATYTQEILMLIGGAALLFLGGVLFWFVAKYVFMVALLVGAILGFFAVLGILLGIYA